MASSGPAPSGAEPPTPVVLARRSRFLGEQYADVTKLREHAARHDHAAGRIHQRIARLNTRIEKLRHLATLLREKGAKVLGAAPELDREIRQKATELERARSGNPTGILSSDVTALQYRLRKVQQKAEDLKGKARHLELRAATRTQRASELKVKVDRLLETARLREEEAAKLRGRADRLQLATDQDSSSPGGPASTAPATPVPPP